VQRRQAAIPEGKAALAGGFFNLCSKSSLVGLATFRDKIMQRLGFPINGLIVLSGVALGLAALASVSNLPKQSTTSPASLRPCATTHEIGAGFQARLQRVIEFGNANEITPTIETVWSTAPRRSRFLATLVTSPFVFTVTNTNDTGTGSLRQAINEGKS
jgi:hypothetical protein